MPPRFWVYEGIFYLNVEMTLFRILSETAKSHPDNMAVISGEGRYTYAQFKDRVDRLASGFISIGICKNDKIAVIHKNCHRFLEAYFAAAKIGAILVPVNYRLIPQDFIYILNDSQARLLIAQPNLISSLPLRKSELPLLKDIVLTEPDEAIEFWKIPLLYESMMTSAISAEEQSTLRDDSEVAQIYYTSGTTGKPKGVVLTHRNNLVHADRAIKELKLLPDDRWLHVSPMFHLADAWAVWAITKVAAVHVMIPGFEPQSVLEAIEQHRITLSNFIPTMLNILVHCPDVSNHDFSSLRLVLSGGAPIAKEIIRKVIETMGCDYIQTYGLTETSPFLTMSLLKQKMKSLPFEEKLRYLATTGRPFCGVQIKVVKEDRSEVIPNEEDVGEIIAKSETITPGYWRLPEETSKRILDDWFYTRDLAVINSEGYITIVDRKEDMIITGGENVYSIEVEDALYSHPDILEAAVIGLTDDIWGEIVAAVVVVKDGADLKEREVIRSCEGKLAPFKIPKKVIFADHLPKTGSEKIYKYKLREKYRNQK